jgi:predicted N-acyltransferase
VRECESSVNKIWMDYEHKVRKNVKCALRNGVSVEVDPSGARLDEFLRVYTRTMQRRKALMEHCHGRQFFEDLIKRLSERVHFFHALKNGQVIATEVVLISDENVYSFLGGAEYRSLPLRPTDLLKHTIILWCCENRKRSLVLGGGYAGEDGIFRYKKSFAPKGLVPFRVGKAILEPKRYSEFVRLRGAAEASRNRTWEPDSSFFPAYRSPH